MSKKRKSSNKKMLIFGVTIGIFFIGAVALVFLKTRYEVTSVSVEGNIHYTDEQIENMIMEGPGGRNSLVLSLKYRNKEIKDIPFVETMDVIIVNPNTIKIIVYEKALAGYIEYLERYMYFDKDGIVVESSEQKTGTIPLVTGLKFGHVVLYEKLPVENDSIFQQILSVTQLLAKNEIVADKIYFNQNMEMTLYFGERKVMLGNNDFLDEKIIKLKGMLASLEGKKGTLHMENYTEDTKFVSFELD